jgi:hypothetical protein
VLTYSKDKDGYVVPMTEEQLKSAPAYDLKELVKEDGQFGVIRERSYDYYKVPHDW